MPDRRLRRSNEILAATCVAPLLCCSISAVAGAQPAPHAPPGQYAPPRYTPVGQYTPPRYTPVGQYTPPPYAPVGQYTPPPYAQPVPYPRPYGPQPYSPRPSTSSYTPLVGSNDRDITADRAQSWPIFRLSGGVGAGLEGQSFSRPSFDFDLSLGARRALSRRFLVAFELGYSFAIEPVMGGHFATLGVGPELYGNRYVSVGWTPKLVLGATWENFAIGIRNTISVPLVFHVVTVELGHQYLRAAGQDQHELRAQLGVDLAGIIHLWAWTLATPSG